MDHGPKKSKGHPVLSYHLQTIKQPPGSLEDETLEKAALSWWVHSIVSIVEPSLGILSDIPVAAKVEEQIEHVLEPMQDTSEDAQKELGETQHYVHIGRLKCFYKPAGFCFLTF